MAKQDAAEGPPAKRRKFSHGSNQDEEAEVAAVFGEDQDKGRYSTLLSRPVSPPSTRRDGATRLKGKATSSDSREGPIQDTTRPDMATISSPIQLSRVEGLPARNNVDTVSLRDILGHPLISECWAFNYLIDVDFLLEHFDEDIRGSVAVTIVHGSWKREDRNRIAIEEAVSRHANVSAVTAYMPEAFGTHHSKAFVLFRHDDLAQVVICTGNFIRQDWRMAQAVWRSPLLPLSGAPPKTDEARPLHVGLRFKFDFLAYLNSYGRKLQALITKLAAYDFTAVRAALVASTPGRQHVNMDPARQTRWGWLGLEDVLKRIPAHTSESSAGNSGGDSNSSGGGGGGGDGGEPQIVVQVSSIATLGAEDSWLRPTLFAALAQTTRPRPTAAAPPRFHVVFPTPEDVRRTVDGYACGGSIHTKIQTAAQARQLQYLRPLLRRWAPDAPAPRGDAGPGTSASTRTGEGGAAPPVREAGRGRAGPHIKTYLRFADAGMRRLDWAMTTSANLSTQAWGARPNAASEVRVCSYELGVVVWPGLWAEEAAGAAVEMVPVFKKDAVDLDAASDEKGGRQQPLRVGLRMPYDLPLVPYSSSEEPWCATKSHTEPDWMGRVWQVD